MSSVLNALLSSSNPSIRYKTRVNLEGQDPDSQSMRKLREEIRDSERARLLLSERGADGRIPYHPYAKWYGAHWVLATLAEIDYPSGDTSLAPLRDQVYEWLLSREHGGDVGPHHHVYAAPIQFVRGKFRIHASLEGNALFSTLKLGIADERAERLAQRLLKTQWEDGGWNCDKTPKASHSSFTESLIPFRALALHAKLTNNHESKRVADRASELFLKRHLYRRIHDGRILRDDFVKLHFPWYWHYDILFALKVMGETRHLNDERCHDALDLLESKRLPDGGFPLEKRYYGVSKEKVVGRSTVDWGIASSKHMNEFVTVEALSVLRLAEEATSYLTIYE